LYTILTKLTEPVLLTDVRHEYRNEEAAENNYTMVAFIFTAANTPMQLHSRWSFRPDGKWFCQCSHLLQGRFRYSSSASATLDLQNRSFSQRFEHRQNHFCIGGTVGTQ